MAAFLLVAGSPCAREPDGRVSFRYAWIPSADGSSTKVLRLVVTTLVALEDAQLSVAVPPSSTVAIHPTVVAGVPVAGAWPSAGLLLGPLTAGRAVIFDLDVTGPRTGGGTLAFSLTGRAGGTPVREGVGVTVGHPGPDGVLRGDVLEYPAEQAGQAP